MYFKQKNMTAIRSQQDISDALFEIMKKKSFEKITVTEICEKAMIGRKTFYRNFELREDVIEFRLDQLCQMYVENFKGLSREKYLYHHFSFFKKNASTFIILYQRGFIDMVNQKFSKILPQAMPIWSDDPIEQEYRSAYIKAGIMAIQSIWIMRGYQESVTQIVNIAIQSRIQAQPIAWYDNNDTETISG